MNNFREKNHLEPIKKGLNTSLCFSSVPTFIFRPMRERYNKKHIG